jgi:hypothetical protein
MISQIRPLTQEERQLARAAAQVAVVRDIGERPQRAHFTQHASHCYPPRVTKLITGLCIALLLAAFTPSAIRLYVIGSQTLARHDYDGVAVGLQSSDPKKPVWSRRHSNVGRDQGLTTAVVSMVR